MNIAGSQKIAESQVVQAWQDHLRKQRHLADSEGQPVEVIYPGRLNDGRGGDFRDAVVAFSSEWKRGCIEIHTRSSGWQAHGHHRNPVYNQVVLHVALEQDQPGKAVLQNGQTIPTVILDHYLKQSPQQPVAGLPCDRVSTGPDQLSYLDRAGECRFLNKAFRYLAELASGGPAESLYQGVLEALGYSRNQQPFRELARRMPLARLEENIRTGGQAGDVLARLQGLLLGAASALDWELYKVRPGNSPLRRILALSHLIYRFRQRGWLDTLLEMVRETPIERGARELELAFTVNEAYYGGADCCLPGLSAGPVILGRDRAAGIVINVLLPFAWAWGQRSLEPELSRRARQIYRRYPHIAANSIERHMLDQFSLGPRQVNSALRQQGLIHIYKTLCIQGKCGECGFGFG